MTVEDPDFSSPESAMADFIYAAAMLKRTPRSGFAFLGSGHESVAEHSWLASVLGLVLARAAGADVSHTVLLCLFHDLHEAATGDLNYVNHRYDSANARAALKDICHGTDLETSVIGAWEEFEHSGSLEAQLARDADQLDMICSLRREQASGNSFAEEWLKSAVQRIKTEWGQRLCEAIMATDPAHWWYDQVPQDWWINRRK